MGRSAARDNGEVKSSETIHSSPGILGGTPVFVGTRVPFQTLIDYLEQSQTLDEFLEDFPSVTREQAIAALDLAKDSLLMQVHENSAG
jgi:uncharacterized protein (DUF433 family)